MIDGAITASSKSFRRPSLARIPADHAAPYCGRNARSASWARAIAWSGSSWRSEERLRKAHQVPLRDKRLVAVCVPAAEVDGAVDGAGIEQVHERAWPVVDRLPGNGHVVGVHHAVDEADQHPLRNQRSLRRDDRPQKSEAGVRRPGEVRVMTVDGIDDEAAEEVLVARRGRVLEAAHAQMTGRDPCQHRPRQHRLAAHRAPCRRDSERSRRRYAQGVHGLADDVLPEHRADRSEPIPTTGERRAARAFEMDVMQETVRVDDFAEQEGPPVAQARRVPAELMPGIRLRNGFRPGRNQVAGQEPRPSAPRRNTGSRPSSVANGSLRTSNRRPPSRSPATRRPTREAPGRTGCRGSGSLPLRHSPHQHKRRSMLSGRRALLRAHLWISALSTI